MIDWNKELDEAIAKEPTEKHYKMLRRAAGAWVTCAVGSQCEIIPRYSIGMPKDCLLHVFGRNFYYNINSREWKKAKETLANIEKRSAELIKEITK